MKTLREVLSIVVVLFLGIGYAGSQWSALNGLARSWAVAIDKPAVAQFSLLLLVAAIVLACVRAKREEH